MKVSENVEKGGAVLKMVSSSTGFIKGMMELSLAAATASNVTPSHDSDASPYTDDNDTTAPCRPANGPSLVQSPAAEPSGDGDQAAASRRLVKGLTWLRRRCRRPGGPPSSSDQRHGIGWRGRSATTDSTTRVRPTVIPNSVNCVDRSTVPDKKSEQTLTVRDDNSSDQQDCGSEGVYEKRSKWLKRCGRVADTDDSRVDVLNDQHGTAASGCSSSCQGDAPSSGEKQGVTISVISDGQSNRAECPGNVHAGSVARSSDSDGPVKDEGGVQEAEVVLDPSALKTPLGSDDKSHDRHTSQHIPSVTTAYRPAWQLLQSDMDYSVPDSVQNVASTQQSPLTRRHLGSSATNHTEESEASPSSSDVDFLCNEIGRLVADYMRQHLVLSPFIRLKTMQTTGTPNRDKLKPNNN